MSASHLNVRPKQARNLWKIATVVILILAIASRFYMLGARAVSHDETTHAKYSWNLYAGRGFRHDPLMHGPLLFEASAFFYFLFGVNDFSARLYTALTGIALVMAPLLLRRWLGRRGALLASGMVLISPAITYYSRYTRHDVPLLLFTTLLLWAILRYLDEGKPKWLYWMAAFFPLMYASKENAYIYTLIFLILLALPFAWQIFKVKWAQAQLFRVFLLILVAVTILGGIFVLSLHSGKVVMYQEEGESRADEVHVVVPWWGRVALALVFAGLLGAVVVVYYGVGARTMRALRLFDVLMVLGTLTLPLGAALFINFVAGVEMKTFYDALLAANLSTLSFGAVVGSVTVLLFMLGISIVLGLWWDAKRWPYIALVYYAVFFILFSSIFTYGWGVFTGLIGGLAYWMAQQGVQRGTQPWYYYGIVGPLYEYLPLLFSIPAGVGAILYALRSKALSGERAASELEPQHASLDATDSGVTPLPFLSSSALTQRFFPLFLLLWSLLSWIAYIYAGEKMPWLFVHIAFPHMLLAAWGLGRWLRDVSWEDIFAHRGWILLVALVCLWLAWGAYQQSTGDIQQVFFSGDAELKVTLERLQPLGTLLGVVGGILLSLALLFWTVDYLGLKRAGRLALLTLVGLIAMYTLRTMVMLNYINFALAKEYMVYAHATPDVKEVMAQVEEISWRLTGTPRGIQLGYSKDVAWPFMWYIDPQYPNYYYFGDAPDPERLLECPVIIAGKPEWDMVEDILGSDYVHFQYKHIWWPVEDYKNLTPERIRNALFDPSWRAALKEIMLNRDYTLYAQLRDPENPFTLKTWPHRMEFRFYVRRDLTQEIWSYRLGEGGVQSSDAQATQMPDPYSAGEQSLAVVTRATVPSAVPQGMAAAPDGTLYVTDIAQHRIWHITPEGYVMNYWGNYGTGPGQFNEPWGVAVDAQGNIYVADTWNHRIQKFDPQGKYVLSWGRFAQVSAYDLAGAGAFFGPRDVAIGLEGEIYVTDTGNKRVQVFDPEGNFLGEFGGVGDGLGLMDEPVGIAVNGDGVVFVADTWNRRVQIYTADGMFVRQWALPVWGHEDPQEKPFLTVGDGTVCVADPVHHRVLAFAEDGTLIWALREPELTRPAGLAVVEDTLYVSDAETGQVIGYAVP